MAPGDAAEAVATACHQSRARIGQQKRLNKEVRGHGSGIRSRCVAVMVVGMTATRDLAELGTALAASVPVDWMPRAPQDVPPCACGGRRTVVAFVAGANLTRSCLPPWLPRRARNVCTRPCLTPRPSWPGTTRVASPPSATPTDRTLVGMDSSALPSPKRWQAYTQRASVHPGVLNARQPAPAAAAQTPLERSLTETAGNEAFTPGPPGLQPGDAAMLRPLFALALLAATAHHYLLQLRHYKKINTSLFITCGSHP
jgi:hypothetical protein